MTHGSLFSGIGGFDLAAEWMGWENKFHCEWNEFGQKVLNYYWPNAKSYGDITKTDFNVWGGEIDIVTGGFPCQPYSQAGKRKGKEDERHLWPEMLRAIREIQPSWVVGENVLGLVNWSGGLVFHEVQTDLEAAGYEVWPYVLPACATNAPHRRDRVWFVAYSASNGHERRNGNSERNNSWKQSGKGIRERLFNKVGSISEGGDAANPNSNGQHRSYSKHEINASKGGFDALGNIEQMGGDASDTEKQSSGRECEQQQEQGEFGGCNSGYETDYWQNFPTQSPICNGNDGLSTRLDTITFPKWRNESIKAGGMQ